MVGKDSGKDGGKGGAEDCCKNGYKDNCTHSNPCQLIPTHTNIWLPIPNRKKFLQKAKLCIDQMYMKGAFWPGNETNLKSSNQTLNKVKHTQWPRHTTHGNNWEKTSQKA